jgi:hypothetical protein
MLSVAGLAVVAKSGGVLKTAVCTFSGMVVPALAMATHVVVPETLLPLQPVWYAMGVPTLDATTL